MKIKVTENHIKNGQRAESSCCSVALALMEQVAGLIQVSVGTTRIRMNTAQDFYTITTPPKAERFINRFDAQEVVEPFEFELKIKQ